MLSMTATGAITTHASISSAMCQYMRAAYSDKLQ